MGDSCVQWVWKAEEGETPVQKGCQNCPTFCFQIIFIGTGVLTKCPAPSDGQERKGGSPSQANRTLTQVVLVDFGSTIEQMVMKFLEVIEAQLGQQLTVGEQSVQELTPRLCCVY